MYVWDQDVDSGFLYLLQHSTLNILQMVEHFMKNEDTPIKFVRFVRSGVSCVMAVSWEGPPGARSIIHSQGATGATKAELKFQSPRHNTGSFTPQYFSQTFWCIRHHQCHGQLSPM